MTACLAAATLIGAVFDVASIDVQSPDALAFLAGANDDAHGNLFVIDGNTLRIVIDKNTIWAAELPPGTACFDVADLDGDQSNEIIAVAGRVIYLLPLSSARGSVVARRLFECDSLFSAIQGPPTPRVLVIKYEGRPCLGLPVSSNLELRRVDGGLIDRFPTEPIIEEMPEFIFWTESLDSARGVGFSFEHRAYLTPVLGDSMGSALARHTPADPARTSLHRIRRTISMRSELDIDTTRVVLIGMREASVLAAKIQHGTGFKTGVSIASVSTSSDQAPIEEGPMRSYPGRLGVLEDSPDFNGDGFADLLLWNTPMPGTSVESLVRTLLGRTWPVRLTVHLFSVEKQRFEPSVAASLSVKAPVPWFLDEEGPVRHPVFRDFNGDGNSDLAFCTDENTFSVWLYQDGFKSAPDETHVFDEPITRVELTADLDESGRHAIVLRSEHHRHALLPASAPPAEEPRRP